MGEGGAHSGWGLAGLGVALALGLLASATVVSRTLLEIKREGQSVEVKGFAEKRILSDRAVWSGTFTTRGAALTQAYATLERHRAAVVAFLEQQGVPEAERELLPVMTQVLFRYDEKGMTTHEVEGYALTQQVRVSSPDVERVTRVANESSGLIREGIELTSLPPEYFYTKLEEEKIAMLGEATEDARRRAEEIARRSGSRIGALREARQGVFQITPAYSTEVSNYGRSDTTSREKAIKAVVTVDYAIDAGTDG